jgi:hypothetical protein
VTVTGLIFFLSKHKTNRENEMKVGDYVEVTDERSIRIRKEDGAIVAGTVTRIEKIGDATVVTFKSCGHYAVANAAILRQANCQRRWRK